MAQALIAGVVTIFVVGPLAAWAIVHVGNTKPTPRPATTRANHPSTERRDERR